jgi:hypothetical protein
MPVTVLICAICAGDLRVVHRIERVLVLHLRDQQLEEAVGLAWRWTAVARRDVTVCALEVGRWCRW